MTDPYRNPSRGPEDMYALVLLSKGRIFRVFAPLTKNQANAARRSCRKSWTRDHIQLQMEAKVIQCWTDWGAQEREDWRPPDLYDVEDKEVDA